MPTSKKNPARAGKQQAFSQQKQQQAQKRATGGPKTQIVPQVNWPSGADLKIRGTSLEGFNKTLELLYHAMQNFGQIYQETVALNIKSEQNPDGLIEVSYEWNNGEAVTDVELKVFQAKMQEMQALRSRQATELQQQAAVQTTAKSGLVGVDGEELTKEKLEQKGKIIV
jgi:hypothetical protein